MSFEQISYLAQMVASVGVIVSLIFVGLQIRQNTGALQRNEHNSTMAQWTVVRMAIAKHRDIAELMTAGLHGQRALDAADQLRLEQMLQENAWASFHIWERTQRGIFPKGTFELSCGAHLCGLLGTVAAILQTFSSITGTITPQEIIRKYAPAITATGSGLFMALMNILPPWVVATGRDAIRSLAGGAAPNDRDA